MKEEIRHRRLYAFYNSKVLNLLYMVGIISLMQMVYTQHMTVPVLFAAAFFVLFIGYSLWLWIKKPAQIVINTWISDFSGLFSLYYLAVVAFDATSIWWYVAPIAAFIILILINMFRPQDKIFVIN